MKQILHLLSFVAFTFGIGMLVSLAGCSNSTSQTSAPQANLTWTNATANTDGSVFSPATDQKQITIQYGTTKGGPYPSQAISPGAATAMTVALPASPTCGVSYYFVLMTVGNDGMTSAPSAEISKALVACAPATPNPPTNVAAS